MTILPRARGFLAPRRAVLGALSVLAMIAAIPRIASSQSDDTTGEAAMLVYCVRARDAALTRRGGPEYRQELVNLQSCPELAADVLLELWRRPPADTGAIRTLGRMSGIVHDARILSTITQIALQPTAAQPARLAAFQALVRFCDPAIMIWFQHLSEPDHSGYTYATVGLIDHPSVPISSSHPAPPDACASVVDTFNTIAEQDADSTTRAIAHRLRKYLLTRNQE